MDYSDHNAVVKTLERLQGDDHDQREEAIEVSHFLYKADGQWEPDVVQRMGGRPRYTFDWCTDIVDDIAGEMEQADFAMRVKPAGGEATEDVADIYDGMLRNIQNISNADDIFNDAAREMVAIGVDGWRIKQDYSQTENTFDQDLYVVDIENYLESVWWDQDSKECTHATSNYCYVLESFTDGVYTEKWPKGKKKSLGTSRTEEVYDHKPEQIVVGELLYKVRSKQSIFEMTNGRVYADDAEFAKVKDELAAAGVTVKRERKRTITRVHTRLFDAGGWLTEPKETVFSYIPVIPTYANFRIQEGKVIYWGAIHKKRDAQRVYNYAESRKVEEGALAPRKKIFMDPRHAKGHEKTIQSLNTNSDPVQLINFDESIPLPYESQGPQVNPGLETVAQSAMVNLRGNADRMPGEPVGLRSGVAVEREQSKQDTKSVKYFSAQQKAMKHTARILVDAIPRVYDTRRTVRVLGEDGTSDMVTLNDRVFDQDSQTWVEINNLAVGHYDVTCEVGPAFRSRQSETTAAFNDLATIDPTILQEGKDVWLRNIPVPGMDIMADRARASMLQQGMIPESEMTDKEKAELAAAQQAAEGQEQPPDPMMVAAQAEVMKAQNQEKELQIKYMDAETKRIQALTGQKQAEIAEKTAEFNAKLVESRANQANAAAFANAAKGHKTFGESGLVDMDIATAGVDMGNEIASDLLTTKVPIMEYNYDPATGGLIAAQG
jgi:hypothetical protein